MIAPPIARLIANLFVRPSRRDRRRAARLGVEWLEGRDVPTTVAGTVFDDADGNGTLDGGEGGVAGITVEVQGDYNVVLGSDTTASDGSYEITGLSAGYVTVVFVIPSNVRYAFAYPANSMHDDYVGVTLPGSGTETVNHSIYPDPTVSVAVVGDAVEGGAVGVFRFTRTGWTGHGLSFQYTVATGAGQATAGTDYGVLSGYGEFPEGESTVDVEVTAYLDAAADPDEEITVEVTASSAVLVGGDPAVMAIVDTPQVVTVARVADAVEGGADGTFEFTRWGYLDGSLTVSYTVASTGNGVATSGTDYTALSGTVTFAAYSDTATATVDAVTDGAIEDVEWVSLMIDEDSDYEIGWVDGAVVLIRDQTREVSVEGVQDAEEGGTDGTLRFTRTGSLTNALTVYYTVATTGPSLATPSSDYTTLTGSVTFNANAATADVTIDTTDDSADEPDEVVMVTIDTNSAYTIGVGTGQVWITDDDYANGGGVMYWISDDEGDWWDPANWDLNREPKPEDDLYFTSSHNGNMLGFDTETDPLTYAGLHVLDGHTGTITLTVPVTFETLELHSEDAVIDQPEGVGSALTITSFFNWTDGTINASATGSTVTIDDAQAVIAPKDEGTVYTGSTLVFTNGTLGLIAAGTIELINGALGITVQQGGGLRVDPGPDREAQVRAVGANGAATISAIGTGSYYEILSGRWIAGGSVVVAGGRLTLAPSTRLRVSPIPGSNGSFTMSGGGVTELYGRSILEVTPNSRIIITSGTLTTKYANGTSDATIGGGRVEFDGGEITIDGGNNPHLYGTLRVNADFEWSGGTYRPCVDNDGGDSDELQVSGAFTIEQATPTISPTLAPSARNAAGNPVNPTSLNEWALFRSDTSIVNVNNALSYNQTIWDIKHVPVVPGSLWNLKAK